MPHHTKNLWLTQNPYTWGTPQINREHNWFPSYDLEKYLAGILKTLVGNTFSFIKYSSTFVEMISNFTLEPEDIIVSFDVVSLFMKKPIDDAMDAIKKITNPDIAKLIEVCLRSTFFSFLGEFYE